MTTVDDGLVAFGPAGAALLSALHRRCFDPGWQPKAVAEILSMPGTFALVRHKDGQPVGFVIATAVVDQSEIIAIGVDPDGRRQGIARDLMAAAGRQAKAAGAARQFLEVAEDNADAIGLYRACGFVEDGRRKGYYARQSGAAVDALLMARDL